MNEVVSVWEDRDAMTQRDLEIIGKTVEEKIQPVRDRLEELVADRRACQVAEVRNVEKLHTRISNERDATRAGFEKKFGEHSGKIEAVRELVQRIEATRHAYLAWALGIVSVAILTVLLQTFLRR